MFIGTDAQYEKFLADLQREKYLTEIVATAKEKLDPWIGDYTGSFELMHEAAMLGHTQSKYRIGLVYLDGLWGIPKNEKQAVYWISEAASENWPGAKYRMYIIYRDGYRHIKPDQSKATIWLKFAREHGLPC